MMSQQVNLCIFIFCTIRSSSHCYIDVSHEHRHTLKIATLPNFHRPPEKSSRRSSSPECKNERYCPRRLGTEQPACFALKHVRELFPLSPRTSHSLRSVRPKRNNTVCASDDGRDAQHDCSLSPTRRETTTLRTRRGAARP